MKTKKLHQPKQLLRFLWLPLLILVAAATFGLAGQGVAASTAASDYSIVDTGQTTCYDAASAIPCPAAGEAFYGQDAQVEGNQPAYTANGDGTVSDDVTGLMWQQSADTDGDGDIDAADKLTADEAGGYCQALTLAGYDDWRLPSIKQLYSLIDFSGVDPNVNGNTVSGLTPFIDTDYFAFAYGDTTAGERIIDAQYATSTYYVSTTMNGAETMFGVNFADGRIKGYPTGPMPGQSEGKGFYVICVRGNTDYGVNDFVDNGDGTVTDSATGLMWAQEDSGVGLDWEEALAWVQEMNDVQYLGYSDWRLPNAKELQSLVDYTRSPDTTGSAAIDPLFDATSITNEAGQSDYPAYWSSTTHASSAGASGSYAVYVSFGRAMGYMNGRWIDVHGAGAQRSDPKTGDPANWPTGHGPQGDAIHVDNYVRLVRDAGGEEQTPAATATSTSTPLATAAATSTPTATSQAATATPTPAATRAPARPGGIDGVSPTAARQGQRDLLVTITLTAASAPPSQASPSRVTIGDLEGRILSRDGATVRALFAIPPAASTGSKDVVVTFPSPQGDVTFSLPGGFQVQRGGHTTSLPLIRR